MYLIFHSKSDGLQLRTIKFNSKKKKKIDYSIKFRRWERKKKKRKGVGPNNSSRGDVNDDVKDELNALRIVQYKTGWTLTVDWEAEIGSDQRSGSLGPRRHRRQFQCFDA